MGTQEFLEGGFRGKLGETVGYYAFGKRRVRRYVIPNNPRTPAQQSNRAMFAIATRLAQEAMKINGGQGIWDTSTKPEFPQRVGQAMRALRDGATEEEAFPLYPAGWAPPAVDLETLSAVNTVNPDRLTITFANHEYNLGQYKPEITVEYSDWESGQTAQTLWEPDLDFNESNITYETLEISGIDLTKPIYISYPLAPCLIEGFPDLLPKNLYLLPISNPPILLSLVHLLCEPAERLVYAQFKKSRLQPPGSYPEFMVEWGRTSNPPPTITTESEMLFEDDQGLMEQLTLEGQTHPINFYYIFKARVFVETDNGNYTIQLYETTQKKPITV